MIFRLHVYCSLKCGIRGYWNSRVKFWPSTKDSSKKQKMLQDFILTLVHVFWNLHIYGCRLDHQLMQLYTENATDQEFSVVASTSGSLYMCVFRLPSEGEARHTAVESGDCAKLRQQVSHQWVQHPGSLPQPFPTEKICGRVTSNTQSWNGITIVNGIIEIVQQVKPVYWCCQFKAKLHLTMDIGLGFSVCQIRSERQSALFTSPSALLTATHHPPL